MTLLPVPILEGDPLPPENGCAGPARPAVEDLYRRERAGLVRFVAKFTSADAAHDIVQQLFVRLLALSDRGHADIAAPAAYLRQAARNLVKNEAAAAGRRSAHQHVPPEDVALPGPDPIAHLEARDRLRRIDRALSRMKPLTRDIFLARRVDGYSYAEIARRTGLSEKGVEKQMAKAMRLLGRHLHRHD